MSDVVTGTRERAIGALVGLAVGDAVGTTLEFEPPGSFTPITDMVGGGPFRLPVGAWTDDASMAMCLAESILDTGSLDPADQLRRYADWWRHGYWSSTDRCFDIGNTTRGALSRFERTGAITDPDPDDESAANRSLMRLAAVPIRWHTDIAEAAARSGESSRTTHPAARPADACRVMGAMVAALIQGSRSTRYSQTTSGASARSALRSRPSLVDRGGRRARRRVSRPLRPGSGEGQGEPARRHGICTFIDLTTLQDSLEPYAAHVEQGAAQRGLDVRRVAHPIPDMGVIDVDLIDVPCEANDLPCGLPRRGHRDVLNLIHFGDEGERRLDS